MRCFLVLAIVFAVAAPAHADAPRPQKPAVMHFPTLEKMLRRFSRQAGSPSPAERRILAAR